MLACVQLAAWPGNPIWWLWGSGAEPKAVRSTLNSAAGKGLSQEVPPSCGPLLDVRPVQGGRQGEQHLGAMHKQMRGLLEEIKARGPPADDDTSVAAHLLRIRDPATGQAGAPLGLASLTVHEPLLLPTCPG